MYGFSKSQEMLKAADKLGIQTLMTTSYIHILSEINHYRQCQIDRQSDLIKQKLKADIARQCLCGEDMNKQAGCNPKCSHSVFKVSATS